MMRNLPVPVDEEDIEDMFIFADKDKDGKLSYKEFQVRQDQGTEMSDRGHVYLCGQGLRRYVVP